MWTISRSVHAWPLWLCFFAGANEIEIVSSYDNEQNDTVANGFIVKQLFWSGFDWRFEKLDEQIAQICIHSNKKERLISFRFLYVTQHTQWLFLICNSFSLQAVKGAPYYVGAAQTLPRGMYSDRNKNIIGKCNFSECIVAVYRI